MKSSESIEGKDISKRVGKIPQKMDFKAVLKITWRNVSVLMGLLFLCLGEEEAVTGHEENSMSKCTGAWRVGGYLWEVESVCWEREVWGV